MEKAGIYIHIPFCQKKCGYCDFCSISNLTLIPTFINRLINEIEIAEANPPPEPDSTVTFHKTQPSMTEQVEVAEPKNSPVQKGEKFSKVGGKRKIKMKKMKTIKPKP